MDINRLNDVYFWVELVGMVFGFIYVYYQVKKTRKMWYFWFVSSLLNIVVYHHSGFYSMMSIQFYYIVAAVYGIAQWNKTVGEAKDQYGERKSGKEVIVRRFEWKKGAISSLIAVAVYFALVPVFSHFSQGAAVFESQPYWDTLVAVLSMLATYWLSQSYIEQWLIWIVVNAISIVIYFMGGIYFYGILYVAYLVMAVIGLVNWHRNAYYVD